jgi:hypothetical protein
VCADVADVNDTAFEALGVCPALLCSHAHVHVRVRVRASVHVRSLARSFGFGCMFAARHGTSGTRFEILNHPRVESSGVVEEVDQLRAQTESALKARTDPIGPCLRRDLDRAAQHALSAPRSSEAL